MILERGTLLNQRYRIIEILGQGGMGSVYRAVDENLGVEVAVKDNLFTTDEYARQFRREAIILANLRHPNLPRVTDHFVIEGQGQYLVMDYIDGEDLRQRMDRIGVLGDEEVIVIGAAMCDALSYLASRNPPIVHRDIKPGNVKITPHGHIFLVDFGLAKVMMGSQATATGARAMTPGYSPPEQYGTARTDARSDIFSLGATLYAALTGAIPEDALGRTMDQSSLTPIRKRNSRVSKRLAQVIERALEVRPDDRFQSAEEFKQTLINCSSNTRRRVGEFTGDYIVPPPPGGDKPIPPEEPSLPPSVAALLPVEGRDPSPAQPPANRSPLPVSTHLEDAIEAQPGRRGALHGFWLVILLAAILLGIAGLSSYINNPEQPFQTLALIWPGMKATSTNPPPASPTYTLAPVPSATLAAVIPPIPSSASTQEPRPTATAQPTFTPVLTPTPKGGGVGQIAFASDTTGVDQIYLIHSDGTGLTPLTDIQGGACQPAWSPDGMRLVFISPCDGNHESYANSGMFVINADGSGLSPLPTGPGGGDYDPAWSPDGKKIVYTSVKNSGRPQLYIYSLGETEPKRISEEFSRDMQPSWSPDGKRIAFISVRQSSNQVWIMDADGTNRERFSRNDAIVNSHPRWSPDGSFIIFTQLVGDAGIPRLVIASVQSQGWDEVRLGQEMFPMREGVFSPDGLWIAFEGWPAGIGHDIFVIAANGGGRNTVTNQPRTDFDPAWRPLP